MATARKNRRRRRNRSRLGFLFKILCVIAVVVALTMGATVFFQVEEIVVNGNERYSKEEIIEATGIQMGDNLYHMNKFQITAEVRQLLPYIEGASIRRSLPNTIVITVEEWDAVACIAVPDPTAEKPAEEPAAEPEDDKTEEKDKEKDEEEPEEPKDPPKPATEPWLISVRGKLLEPAPPDSKAMVVSGITPLDPEAGTMLVLPEEENFKLTALLELLDALEELDRTDQVSAVKLNSTWADLRYQDRFDVKLPLDEDFRYKLKVLEEVVTKTTEKHGDQAKGAIDLTREDCDAVYSPAES